MEWQVQRPAIERAETKDHIERSDIQKRGGLYNKLLLAAVTWRAATRPSLNLI